MFDLCAMHDELEKISASSSKKSKGPTVGQSIGAGLAGGMIAGHGGRLGSALASRSLAKDIERSGLQTTAEEAGRLREAIHPTGGMILDPEMVPSKAVHVPTRALSPSGLGEAVKAGLPRQEAERALAGGGMSLASAKGGGHFMAHELGHGRLRTSGVGKVISHLRGPATAIGGLGALGLATFADPESKKAKYAPLLGAAGVAPILADEAYASLKGYGAMKRLGYNPAAMGAARRQLGKAFGTYALGVGLPAIAAPYVVRKLRQRMARKREAAEK